MSAQGRHTVTEDLGSQEELYTTSELATQEGHAASGEQEGEDLGKLDYSLYSFCPIISTDTAAGDLGSQEELYTTSELATQEGHAAAGELGFQEGESLRLRFVLFLSYHWH